MPKRIFVAGHRGMVGSAIVEQFKNMDSVELILRTRDQLDLTNQNQVRDFFVEQNVDEIYLAAAKVGGIHANNEYPAEFIYENLMIEANVIHQAYKSGISKLLFLGSSCIYPKFAEQPMLESALLTGVLEPTNEPYALAKIVGIKLCESYNRQYGVDYRSVMPTNLYGLNDNFHPENSHVIPSLLSRFHEAKISNNPDVVIWGTGTPKREFLHVNDLASACVFLMNIDKDVFQSNTQEMLSHINIGVGQDISIAELAALISEVVGYQGNIVFDRTKLDGAPRKLMDVSRVNEMGWEASVGLKEGLQATYQWYLDNYSKVKR